MSRKWKPAPMTKADEAVYAVMQDMKLEPGQMLLLGPGSVRVLSTEGGFKGSLPDRFIFTREEWTTPPVQTKRRRGKRNVSI